ncbi:MAG: type II secretion system protein GspG [Candidatus Ancaeobacter aquaticus]|nr:type II secretion system protein GspG [Candidatus Ancaeobacter aquaticus]
MKRNNGFTLLELLAVIAIVIILAGILIPSVGVVRKKAKSARAQADIESLCVALKMLEADFGLYPTATNPNDLADYLGEPIGKNADGSINLTPAATDVTYGPYMEFKQKNLTGVRFDDPWSNAYIYTLTNPDPTNIPNRDFYIHSFGPNGTNNQGGTDDVYNW